jgi:predicted RNA-binding Zn-ribbon protein involved in translation (DUF1610 family)
MPPIPPPPSPSHPEPKRGTDAGVSRFPCGQCGARLEFEPGTASLTCPYCGHHNPIATSPAAADTAEGESPPGSTLGGQPAVQEVDFHATLAKLERESDHVEALTVTCDACAATITKPPGVTSYSCPFCATPVVSTAASSRAIKPNAVLPFVVTREQATQRFRAWLGSLWFAPTKLKRGGSLDENLSGMYVPAWTFDCQTHTDYRGKRGEYYYVNVPRTVMVNGKATTQMTRQRRTKWYPAMGQVTNEFDDVLVVASDSLPPDMMRSLEPWDTKSCVAYQDAYLSGFLAEVYKVGLEPGFEIAKQSMQAQIQATIRRDIGGDEQVIDQYRVDYRNIGFKHLLLPVWISAYRFDGKVYRFLINARTGEVQGQRPYSAFKIVRAVGLGILALIILVVIARAMAG